LSDAFSKLKQRMEAVTSQIFEVVFSKAVATPVPVENISDADKGSTRAHSVFLRMIHVAIEEFGIRFMATTNNSRHIPELLKFL